MYLWGLHRWADRTREGLLTRRHYRCGCGCTKIYTNSYDRRSFVICRGCGRILRTMRERQPAYAELVA